jgi:sugar transferase (PEP-CTERM/EpsH1 system associated)
VTGADDPRPLVAHLVYRFAMGGMERGIVTLIDNTPFDRFRHAVIALTDYTDFAKSIRTPDVPVIALHKPAGKGFGVHTRLWRVLREMRPAILHTRNLGTMEFQTVAAAAGVPARVHGEHGRDIYDIDGSSFRYNLLRKGMRGFIHHYTTVSRDLAGWLAGTVGVRPDRVTQIYNGVDTAHFQPRGSQARPAVLPDGFVPKEGVVIGCVGRMEVVKDHANLVRAFLRLTADIPEARQRARLVIIGDGSERKRCLEMLRQEGASELAWLPGERLDIPELLQAFDVFALPSLGEGISNTILEAMATGLPVVATRVGGNVELVEDDHTGSLVPAADPMALAAALGSYVLQPELIARRGDTSRQRVEQNFTIQNMVHSYLGVYDQVRARGPKAT